MMNVSLLLGTLLLAGAMAPVAIACSIEPGCSPNANSPPPMPSKHQALLHSRCFSACLRLVINKEVPHMQHASSHFLQGKCSRVQAVDECKAGCVEGSHRHNIAPNANHCTKKCSTICRKESIIKWAGYHGMPNCTRTCHVPNCVSGCMMIIKHHHPATGPSLLPPVAIHKIKNSTVYSVKGFTSLAAVSSWHKKALHHSALVIKVDDKSNSSHYYWLPKLDIELDLGHFACQAVNVSVMAVNGNKTTHFSHSTTKCIHQAAAPRGGKPSKCHPGNYHHLVHRLSQVEKKLDKVLTTLSTSHGKTFEEQMKDIDADIKKVLKKISKKN